MLTNLGLLIAKGFLPVNMGAILNRYFYSIAIRVWLFALLFDAFLWRFREAYQRETVLPYLKTAQIAKDFCPK